MKLKAIFYTLAIVLLTGFSTSAQEDTKAYDEENCGKYRSLYYQYLKQGMIRDACTFWSMAVDYCGDSLDGKFYKNGRVAYMKLKKKIDKSNTEKLQEIDDTLAWIYEQRMKIEKDPDWELDYAVMLVSNKSKDYEKMDKLFENIHTLKDEASYAQIRSYFTHLILNKFNEAPQEEKEAARELVIEEYIVLSEYCQTAIKKHKSNPDQKKGEKYVKRYEAAQDFLDKYFVKIANECSVLTPVLDKKFDELPEGEAAMKTINKYISLMERQKCTESDTYEKYVKKSVEINPTAAGFAGLGNVQLAKGQADDAVNSLNKAVELEGDGDNKSKYLLMLAKAQYTAHQYSAAFRTAKQVEGDERGEAMVICGNSIAATANGCGESTFERKANYWLANDYYRKAASLGAEVSTSKFLSSAPSKEDMFAEGVSEGSSVSLSCWGESTTAR